MTLHSTNAKNKTMTEAETITAIEANMVGYYREIVSRWPEVELHDEPNWTWTISDKPYRLFNFVLRPRFPVDQADAYIEAAIARCKARGVSTVWKVAPTARPSDLSERLLAHGFVAQDDIPAMGLDLRTWDDRPPKTPNLAVREVCDAASVQAWVSVFAQVYHFPAVVEEAFLRLATFYVSAGNWPVRNYLAYWDDEPIACSTVFLKDGTAGIYNVGTLEHARGKGAGREVTAAPLRIAQKEGYQLSSLQSTDIGFPVYQRIGFRPYFSYRYYGWSPFPKI